MSSIIGNNLKVSIFGQSHSEGIGVVVDGLPPGFEIDMEELQAFLDRRAPGQSKLTTQRKEADIPEILSGIKDGITCGAPFAAIIRNSDTRSKDYSNIAKSPRPGHADYTAHVKYAGAEDYRGGGHFSGRLTAPLCIAGGIAIQMLEVEGIKVASEIVEVGGVSLRDSDSPDEIIERIVSEARSEGDSVGGIIECRITGVPAGLGDPIFDGVENRISQAVFGIPAVKGIEFGAGFEAARMKGSENNDEFYTKGKRIKTKTNNSGGILGGITTGEDIIFRVAFKPTPSIAKEQRTVNYDTGKEESIVVQGRHDPCIVLRARPCVEAAAAIIILDYIV